jgi:hypothetical protein
LFRASRPSASVRPTLSATASNAQVVRSAKRSGGERDAPTSPRTWRVAHPDRRPRARSGLSKTPRRPAFLTAPASALTGVLVLVLVPRTQSWLRGHAAQRGLWPVVPLGGAQNHASGTRDYCLDRRASIARTGFEPPIRSGAGSSGSSAPRSRVHANPVRSARMPTRRTIAYLNGSLRQGRW